MSICNGRLRAALGGLTVALLICASASAEQKPSSNPQTAPGAEAQRSSAPAAEINRTTYKPSCASPEKREDAELCEDIKANQIATINIAVSLAAFGALIWTLFETRRAANAAMLGVREAGRAALAAEKSLAHAQVVTDRQLRPYLYVTEPLDPKPMDETGRIEFCIKNFGQTPARNVRLQHAGEVVGRPLGLIEIGLSDKAELLQDIPPGDHTKVHFPFDELPDGVLPLLKADEVSVVLRIRVTYEVTPDLDDFHDVTTVLAPENIKLGILNILSNRERNRQRKINFTQRH